MTCLLDTHFLIWIVSESKRLKAYPWLKHYEPWRVSPISFLEIQMLSEIGRLTSRLSKVYSECHGGSEIPCR